jgi:hypothetical protein
LCAAELFGCEQLLEGAGAEFKLNEQLLEALGLEAAALLALGEQLAQLL